MRLHLAFPRVSSHSLRRWPNRAMLLLLLTALAAVLQWDTLALSPAARAAIPHAFSIEGYVVRNLPAKVFDWFQNLLPGNRPPSDVAVAQAVSYFELGERILEAQGEIAGLVARGGLNTELAARIADVERELVDIVAQRDALRGAVEDTLERAVTSTLEEQGLERDIGWIDLVFPPVIFHLDQAPKLLVVSPRDRIALVESKLLSADISLVEAETLEGTLASQQDQSSLVLGLGGLAVYPSLVPDTQPLRTALQTIAHEWLHQYWLFAPLGRAYFSTPEMTTLNETAAEMAGRELGDLVYQNLGFQVSTPPPNGPQTVADPDDFDFNAEMRETRLTVDRLLAEGQVEAAEAYMEERRTLFVRHGYGIRKLNQAYFAFHGTYAESPASSSPIANQLQRVREMSPDIGSFVRRMSGLGAYQEFLVYLDTLSPASE